MSFKLTAKIPQDLVADAIKALADLGVEPTVKYTQSKDDIVVLKRKPPSKPTTRWKCHYRVRLVKVPRSLGAVEKKALALLTPKADGSPWVGTYGEVARAIETVAGSTSVPHYQKNIKNAGALERVL